jgi:hypothetical protein
MSDIKCNKHVSVNILRAAVFLLLYKQDIINWHVWLYSVCRNFRHNDREENLLNERKDYSHYVSSVIGINRL